MSHLQTSQFNVAGEGFDLFDVVAVHVQHVNVGTELGVGDAGEVALGAVGDPVDAKIVTMTVDGAFLLVELAVDGEGASD